jgi:transposase InsO family protein
VCDFGREEAAGGGGSGRATTAPWAVHRGHLRPALRAARDLGIDISMGSIGDCYDNAVCEAFHSTLKRELVHRRPWPTRAELKTAMFAYIEGFYNTRRRHSTLNHYSPRE